MSRVIASRSALERVRGMKEGEFCECRSGCRIARLEAAAARLNVEYQTERLSDRRIARYRFIVVKKGSCAQVKKQKQFSKTFTLTPFEMCYFAALCHGLRLINEKANERGETVEVSNACDALIRYVRRKGDELVKLGNVRVPERRGPKKRLSQLRTA